MGIDANATRCLLYARSVGVNFARTATIGRQSLLLNHRQLKRGLVEFGDSAADEVINSLLADNYAERLLEHLGASQVHSLDNSVYEGATHVHDLNQPLPSELAGRYTTILDAGSLEHVFNFPAAMKSCMEMLAVGGHYLGITPANNFLGHGFYQFSPELYFSVFVPENGFELPRMIAFEDRPRAAWYAVKNPRDAGRRVTLLNRRPVLLFVLAKKIAVRSIFEAPPQQSDYLAIWQTHASPAEPAIVPSAPTPLYHRIKARIPNTVKHAIKLALRRRSVCSRPGFDPRFFQPFDPTPRSDRPTRNTNGPQPDNEPEVRAREPRV